MRAFTIWQPWASLIMVGAKPNEFRGKSYLDYINHPQVGDRIMVHAGARAVKYAEVLDLLSRLEREDDHTGLIASVARPLLKRVFDAPKMQPILPLGCALGTAVIGEPQLACDLFKLDIADSDRGAFNYAWPLSDVRAFDAPIPMRGAQGFWHVPDELVREALAA